MTPNSCALSDSDAGNYMHLEGRSLLGDKSYTMINTVMGSEWTLAEPSMMGNVVVALINQHFLTNKRSGWYFHWKPNLLTPWFFNDRREFARLMFSTTCGVVHLVKAVISPSCARPPIGLPASGGFISGWVTPPVSFLFLCFFLRNRWRVKPQALSQYNNPSITKRLAFHMTHAPKKTRFRICT